MPHANSDEKNKLIREFGELRGQRGTFEEHWRAAAEIGSPRDNIFNQQDVTQGVKVRERQYDNKAELSLDKAAALYGSVTTPENQKWHTLSTTNPELNKIQPVREMLDTLVERLFKLRYAPRSNFSTTKYESDRSLVGFGTKVHFNGAGEGDPRTRIPLWYKPIHLSECFMSENAFGFVDKLYRRMRMTGRQILQQYGEDNVGQSMKVQFERDPETMFEVVHAVVVNPDHDPDPENFNPKTMFRYMSRTWLTHGDDELYLKEGGFRTWPYSVTRDSRRPTEQYGRGTLMKILPDMQMRNQMMRTHIRVAHQNTDPTLLAKDDSSVDINDLRPGRLAVGGLSADGSPAIAPLFTGSSYEISQDFLNEVGKSIDEAFGLNLFIGNEGIEGRDRVTATEIMARDQERARLMTPLAAKDEAEGLQTQIEREIDILQELGMMPDIPGELMEAGGEYEIVFVNPLAVSRRSDEAIGAVQTVQHVIEAAGAMPDVLDTINWTEYAGIVADANSSPAKLLNSPEEIAAIREQRAIQEQAEMLAQAAPGVGRGIKDIASAEQIATEGAPA